MTDNATEPVFLGYDRASLDREYFIRGRVPEWDAKVAQFQTQSLSRRESGMATLDIAYGRGARQTLDVFEPVHSVSQSAPVFVFIHGGYWRSLDKCDFSFVAQGFDGDGVVTVVVNYGLLPESRMADVIGDVRAAIQWLVRHVADHGGDPNRLFICGHSAGAQLAGHAAATNWTALDAGLPSDVVKGLIGISGVYDLRPIQQCFLNDIGAVSDDELVAFGADTIIAAHASCPAVFAYGGLEGREFERQSREQVDIWRKNGASAQLHQLGGLNHATTVEQLGDRNSEICRIVRSMIFA